MRGYCTMLQTSDASLRFPAVRPKLTTTQTSRRLTLALTDPPPPTLHEERNRFPAGPVERGGRPAVIIWLV